MQKSRQTIIRIAAFVLIIAAVGKWAWKQSQKHLSPPTEQAENAPNTSNQNHHVLVTYFTSDVRCITCKKIETLTLEAMEQGFAEQLKNQSVVFQTINYDRPENNHFTERYQLAFKTVVIAEYDQGKEQKWNKYDDVWQLVDDPSAFKTYLQDGVRQHLTTSTPDA